MRGMPFNLQAKGVLQVLEVGRGGGVAGEESGFWGGSWKKRKGFEGLEPRSVLDSRRSPSPPTSSSTLSSSLGGGGGSNDTAGVAAVTDNNNPAAHKWPPSSDSTTTTTTTATAHPSSTQAAEEGGAAAHRREEWASELQPIPADLEIGGDKCGMGVEDWEAMLSMPAPSPSQEQTFLQWMMADGEDPSAGGALKQQHLLAAHGAVEFDGNSGGGLGFGMVDPGFGFYPIGSLGGGASSVSASAVAPSPLSSAGGFSPISSVKVPNFGNPANNPVFPPPNSLPLPLSLPPGVLYQEPIEEKQLIFGHGLVLNQHQQSHPAPNPAFFLPSPAFATQHETQHLVHPPVSKRHHSTVVESTCQISPKAAPFPEFPGPDHFLRRNQPQQQQQGFPQLNSPTPYHLQQRLMKPKAAGDEVAAAEQQQQQQALVDQLFKVAELIEAGNSVSARGILARLNHQLPSPVGKPLQRSAFYFKEALHLITNIPNTPSPTSSPSHHRTPATPLDVVLKLGTYKAFSEFSPVLQFTNFTCIQALLEELSSSDRIHIIDFDIGVGGQWSSFMQELAQRRCSSATVSGNTPFLKITAFASNCTHHPLELHLTRENLSHFANDLNIPFEFNVLSLHPFDPSLLLTMCAGVNEAIAVNLPVSSTYHQPIPSLLQLVKQLSPKIVVSVDHGCDRIDLPFSHQFLHAFQSCTVLLDSIDAAGTSLDVSNKIERFLLQPRIENALLGRLSSGNIAGDKMRPWQTLFASTGFVPVQFSNFTETQAECLLKRVQVRGFHVEKRQASLFLCWQRGELVSVSAWKC